jgi:hypothetical protein
VIALTKYRFEVFGHAVVTAPRAVGQRRNRSKDDHCLSEDDLPHPTPPYPLLRVTQVCRAVTNSNGYS